MPARDLHHIRVSERTRDSLARGTADRGRQQHLRQARGRRNAHPGAGGHQLGLGLADVGAALQLAAEQLRRHRRRLGPRHQRAAALVEAQDMPTQPQWHERWPAHLEDTSTPAIRFQARMTDGYERDLLAELASPWPNRACSRPSAYALGDCPAAGRLLDNASTIHGEGVGIGLNCC